MTIHHGPWEHRHTADSWEHRHTAYDTMSPDDVRAAARAARQYQRDHGTNDIVCKAFTLIAAEESQENANLTEGLRRGVSTPFL
jgi:hypothetical protein